jgi:hypothetical protein
VSVMAAFPPDDQPPIHGAPDDTARSRRGQAVTVAILLAIAIAVVLVLLL